MTQPKPAVVISNSICESNFKAEDQIKPVSRYSDERGWDRIWRQDGWAWRCDKKLNFQISSCLLNASKTKLFLQLTELHPSLAPQLSSSSVAASHSPAAPDTGLFVFSTCLLAASWLKKKKKKLPHVEEHPDPLLLQAMFGFSSVKTSADHLSKT